jgi:uncharacterized cysteine cluster protein YcgN (CxxCxxCC family)
MTFAVIDRANDCTKWTARAETVQDIVQLAWIQVDRLSWLNPQEVKTHRLALVEMQENLAQILEDLEEREQ